MDFAKVSKVAAGVASMTALAVPAFAVDLITVDYSTIATGLGAQASTAVTAALPVLAAILGIVLGVKLFKKFSK